MSAFVLTSSDTIIAQVYEGGAADGSWNHYEWAEGQRNPGNGGPYYGFHTYITGTEGTLLAFGEGGGAAPGMHATEPAPVILFKDGKQTGAGPKTSGSLRSCVR